MSQNRPRGSTHGLTLYQLDVREKTREALRHAIQLLTFESPQSQWSYIQVCKHAGLASAVALKKPWNKDLIELIAGHNNEVSAAQTTELLPKKVASRQLASKVMLKLRSELIIKDAEIVTLERENQALRQQIKRLERYANHNKD